MKKRLIMLKTRTLSLDGVHGREYPKGEMISVTGQLADRLISAKWAKEWKPRLKKDDDD